MLVMSVPVFVGVYAIGNPIDVLIGPDVGQEIRLRDHRPLRLDQPLWQQYLTFLGRVLHGDFGRSFVFGMPVMELDPVAAAGDAGADAGRGLGAALVGIPPASMRGYRPDSCAAKLIMTVSILGFSVPTFWIGLVLIMAFAVELQCCRRPAGAARRVPVFGVEWSFLTAERLEPSAAAGARTSPSSSSP